MYLDGTVADVLGLREKAGHLAGSDWHSLIIPSKNTPEPCPVQLRPAPTVTGASFFAFAFGNRKGGVNLLLDTGLTVP